MLYPALAIFSMVACSRLPFGNPSLRTRLVFFMRKIPLGPSARIHLRLGERLLPEVHMACSHSSFQASALPRVADLVEAISSHQKFNSRSGGAFCGPAPEFLRATTPQ